MDDYIAKPFEEENLIRTISNLLKLKAGKTIQREKPTFEQPALYSLETLQKTAGGDKPFVDKMLNTFIKQGNESIDVINEAIAERNIAKIKGVLHKIKPSINYLKIDSLKDILLIVQDWNDSFDEALIEQLELIKQKLAAVMNVMKTDLAN